MGYTTPSPIQSVTWPLAFQGRDITGIAITGSGKTFAFLLAPMVALQKELSATPAASFAGRRMTSWTAKPRILVLSPTRELTNQIFEHADKLCSAGGIGLKAAVVYGGADPWQQKRALPGTNVLIATPGRLTDFMKRGTIDLSEVSTVILDEADRMMDMGFEPQIREILSGVPAERQTLMFSATWPKSVRQISEQFFNNPVQVWIGSTQLNANPRITQEFEIILPSQLLEKLDAALPALLKEGKGLIFCNRKGSVDELVHELKNARYKAAGIHGDKLQSDRESTLHNFNMGKWNIVVGTDVAARGLDFKDVGWVINADFPNNIEDYVHRIGRTARAGKYGKSITYLDKNDPPNLHKAKKLIKILNQAKQQVPPEVLQFLRVAPEEDSWSRRGRRGGRGGGWGGNRNGGGWGNNRNGGGGGWGNSGGGYNNNNGGYNNNNGGDYHSGNGGGYSNGGGYGNSNGGSWGKSNGGDYGSGGGYGNGGGYSSGGGFSNGGGRGGGRGGFGGRGGRGGRGGFGSGGDF